MANARAKTRPTEFVTSRMKAFFCGAVPDARACARAGGHLSMTLAGVKYSGPLSFFFRNAAMVGSFSMLSRLMRLPAVPGVCAVRAVRALRTLRFSSSSESLCSAFWMYFSRNLRFTKGCVWCTRLMSDLRHFAECNMSKRSCCASIARVRRSVASLPARSSSPSRISSTSACTKSIWFSLSRSVCSVVICVMSRSMRFSRQCSMRSSRSAASE
mmetsp:Transcript_2105/g.6341  ORF Transcript_2105/g.6341 Transcript_2105/m.6341 type:complete len:214 (+) Transcript_2105:1436-2077(+)